MSCISGGCGGGGCEGEEEVSGILDNRSGVWSSNEEAKEADEEVEGCAVEGRELVDDLLTGRTAGVSEGTKERREREK